MDPGHAAPDPDAPHDPYASAPGGATDADGPIFEGDL
jgi:hypothetical protein